MKNETKIQAVALLVFFLLALLQLYPLSIHPANSVHDTGDPLLNTWILSWIQSNILSGPSQMFNGNVFFPSENTISFSEHLFPQAVLSLPLTLFINNPILIYNILFICSLIFCAYAMFLLVRYLAANSSAGIVAGIIFAFSTYHINHTPQLQLLSSGFFVLSFYYLHRFFKEKELKFSVLFSVFFTLQALACIYYGLFLISMFVVILPLMLIMFRRDISRSFLIKLIVPIFGAGVILLLFSLPYISLLKFYGFSRGLADGADLSNYFSVSRRNIVLGKLLSPLGTPEGFLFPGILALLLSGFYVYRKRKHFHHMPAILRISLLVLFLGCFITILAIIFTGGFDADLGFLIFSAHDLVKPTLLLLLGLVAFIVLSMSVSLFSRQNSLNSGKRTYYLLWIIFFWALFLSFGKTFHFLGWSAPDLTLPFSWFYDYFPGFSGLRAPSRYGVFVLFIVAVLAGYGFKHIHERFKKKRIKTLALVVVVFLLNFEYLSIPHKMSFVPKRKDIPPTYQWLQDQPEDFALLEFPFFSPLGMESVYMYFSIFHGKKIVNGYSGFLPPSYFYIREVFNTFPSRASIDILKSLDIKYLVFHTKMWKDQRVQNAWTRINNQFAEDLTVEQIFEYTAKKPWEHSSKFGKDIIFRINKSLDVQKEETETLWQDIPTSQWTIKSNIHSGLLHYLRDDNLDTRWSTDRWKKTGDYVQLELDQTLDEMKISLHLGSSANDFAIDFKIEVSKDGEEWMEIEKGYSISEFLEKLFEAPDDLVQNIYISEEETKFIKLTHLGNSRRFWWSIAELDIFKPLL
jgi:hypothetical protein